MANSGLGGGLRLVYSPNRKFRQNGTPYYCSEAADIGVGDCVVISGTSNTSEIVAASGANVGGAIRYPAGALRSVVRATAGAVDSGGSYITGVVLAVDHDPTKTSRGRAAYHKSGETSVLFVCDDPDAIFEVEASGSVAATDMGSNANLNSGATVSAHSGRSNLKLDSASLGNDTDGQLTLIGVSRNKNRQDLGSSGASILVRINTHTESGKQAGV